MRMAHLLLKKEGIRMDVLFMLVHQHRTAEMELEGKIVKRLPSINICPKR